MKRKRGRPKFGVEEKEYRISISAVELKIIRAAYYRLDVNTTPQDVLKEARRVYYVKCDSHARLVNKLAEFKKSLMSSSLSMYSTARKRARANAEAVNYTDSEFE